MSTRPALHFTARAGWINDPLALTWHDGRYHLFFQYVPGRSTWSLDCRWGHAVSTDLLHWDELPVALEPGDGEDGVWSGSLVRTDGPVTIFYTAVGRSDLDAGRIRVAHPDDDGWLRWSKGAVVLDPPADPAVAFFRDPFVLADGEGWRMVVGAALADGPGAVLGYTSPDLATWTFDGVAAQAPAGSRSGWECPQLLLVDGTWVLVVSVLDDGGIQHVAAATGDWHDGRFTAAHWQRLTWGASAYAGSVFRDERDRPCIVFWLRGVGAADGAWTGATSAPQVLAVVDGRVVLRPHPVLDGMLGAHGVELGADGDELVVMERGAALGRMPGAPADAQVLVDGPVVEVWESAGLLALVRDPAG